MAREKNDKLNLRSTVWGPYDRKRKRGRPAVRWLDEILKEMGPDWGRKSHNRKEWKLMAEAYAQKWASCGENAGVHLLSSVCK